MFSLGKVLRVQGVRLPQSHVLTSTASQEVSTELKATQASRRTHRARQCSLRLVAAAVGVSVRLASARGGSYLPNVTGGLRLSRTKEQPSFLVAYQPEHFSFSTVRFALQRILPVLVVGRLQWHATTSRERPVGSVRPESQHALQREGSLQSVRQGSRAPPQTRGGCQRRSARSQSATCGSAPILAAAPSFPESFG